jgi:hypothetical protein
MASALVNNQTDLSHPQSILVTGAHRSGTTWVGKMLAASDQVGYISEPLNVLHRPGVMRTPVKHWYTYICEENEGEYRSALQETINFQYHTLKEIKSLKSIRDMMRMGRDWATFSRGRKNQQRALVKDPFAVFSSLWFYKRLGCNVVITVRHPAGFVSSLKRLNWLFDFSDLLAQPLLIRDLLSQFLSELEEMVRSPGDLIERSCLLWRIVYSVVARFREQQPDFLVIRHEDLANNSIKEYRSLYKSLGVGFTPQIEREIINSSSVKNPREAPSRVRHSYKLNSQANINQWKQRLDKLEIKQIRNLTADIAPIFYSVEDWG